MLGQETVGMTFGPYKIEDYIVVHLSHSKNDKLNILSKKHCTYANGLKQYVGQDIHSIWMQLLNEEQKRHFIGGYWDKLL